MKYFAIIALLIAFQHATTQVKDYLSYPVYTGRDLGLTYTPAQSSFRIWSPPANRAQLIFYKTGVGGDAINTVEMKRSSAGTWFAQVKGNQKGKFYVFRVEIDGKWYDEVPDPYARLLGVNGKRAVVADLMATNPVGWQADKSPVFMKKTDAILYELHIRDASIHAQSGITNKGKFVGLAERGTKNTGGLSTGLDHIKELGVTHVHLLPFYDFFTVDESKPDIPQYNWGYDPLNYNAPEGSYSTNASDGVTRVRELKKLVSAFHANGLRLVMDVVYNHTMFAEKSHMNQLVPGYYYRQKPDGSFSDATACGNEIASERPMVRKFILESALYWVKEFHIDGFRFDLMGVHDIETMNLISRELHKIRPDILLYGEGWTAGSSPLPDSLRALKKNVARLDRIAVFSDDVRDGIKGSVFDHKDAGFASGKPGMEESIKFGVVASLKHPQIDYSKVNYSKAPYSTNPAQTITYCECHDNHVLWDKLGLSVPTATNAEKKEMHKLSLSIVLTSQGLSFLHSGTEFLRSKNGNENSFNSGDSVNAIDWELKTANKDVYEYVRALVKMRKTHPAFRMSTRSEIADNIKFLTDIQPNVVAYTMEGAKVKDSWKRILVVYNGSQNEESITLPAGSWTVFASGNSIVSTKTQAKSRLDLKPFSCSILYLE